MFLHVVNHKTYHRGWVSQMFFEFGAKPPETDLSVYVTQPEAPACRQILEDDVIGLSREDKGGLGVQVIKQCFAHGRCAALALRLSATTRMAER